MVTMVTRIYVTASSNIICVIVYVNNVDRLFIMDVIIVYIQYFIYHMHCIYNPIRQIKSLKI